MQKSDDRQLLKAVSSNRWNADGETIFDLSRAQCDDKAVALGKMKGIKNKKIDIDNLKKSGY